MAAWLSISTAFVWIQKQAARLVPIMHAPSSAGAIKERERGKTTGAQNRERSPNTRQQSTNRPTHMPDWLNPDCEVARPLHLEFQVSTHVTHAIPKPEISQSLTRTPTAAQAPSNHTFARRGSFHVPTEQTHWFFRDEACGSSSQVVTEARRQPGPLNNRHQERCRRTAKHYAQRTTFEGYHHP